MAIVTHPKSNVRIFRPCEIIQIQNSIPRTIDRERFDVLLYTACRYTEFLDFFKMKHRFDQNDRMLKVRNTKAQVKNKFRYVRLSDNGILAVKKYFLHDKSPPSYQTWDQNMGRWAESSGIDRDKKSEDQLRIDRDKNPHSGEYNDIISLKSLRKTYESWLMTMFPQYTTHILLSMGHTSQVSLENYIQLPFNSDDKRLMIPFVKGWDMNIGFDWSELK